MSSTKKIQELVASQPSDIKKGHTYRGEKPVSSKGIICDRTVVDIGVDFVHYRSPGCRKQRSSLDKFTKWAHSDVTNRLREIGGWEVKK